MATIKSPAELNEKFKAWFNSKTIFGLVLIAAPALLSLFGATFTIEDIKADWAETVNQLDLTYNGIVQSIGWFVALYGRIKAKYRLKLPWKN
jgi:hypothetical protein